MPKYSYKAKNLKGKEKQGFLEAQDRKHLASLLKQQGYFLVSVKGDEELKRANPLKLSFFHTLIGVSLPEKLFFTRNLMIMIKTGVSLVRAFEILSSQAKSRQLKRALKDISKKIVRGSSLSSALSSFPKIFSPLYRETVKVGEETGELENVLKILSEQMEREHQLKSKIKSAMVYPAVVLCIAFLIGVFMMIFAVPQLKATFDEMGATLPFTTQAILSLGHFLGQKWPFALVGFLALIFFIIMVLKRGKGGKVKSGILLKAPFLSGVAKQANSALALRMLSSLLSAGVPIVRALEVAAGALGNYYFRMALREASKSVEKGGKLSRALRPHEEIFSPMVLQMMEIGEETGETSAILQKLADFFEDEVTSSMQRISSIVEPVLILFIGGVVGFFAISMMQPMFSLMGGI